MTAPGLNAQPSFATFDTGFYVSWEGDPNLPSAGLGIRFARWDDLDQELYLETMENLRKLDAKTLFYSHGGVGHEPDRLISVAIENTRALGDIILAVLKEGETVESIGRKVGEYAYSRFGIEMSEIDKMMMVGGYSIYFTKKGLV